MIEIDEVEILLGERKKLVTQSFEISSGFWALIGRNGSGKSSFLNSILQSNNLTKGKILLKGVEISEWNSQELSKEISVVYTKPAVFGNFSVKEVIELGRIPYISSFGTLKEEDHNICEQAIKILKIESLIDKEFSVLSDGEKQMVMIARALAQDTSVIILDEPTAFLDVINRAEIIILLKDISISQKKTILFSTHDVVLVPELCNGLLWINDGMLNASIERSKFKTIIDQIF